MEGLYATALLRDANSFADRGRTDADTSVVHTDALQKRVILGFCLLNVNSLENFLQNIIGKDANYHRKQEIL